MFKVNIFVLIQVTWNLFTFKGILDKMWGLTVGGSPWYLCQIRVYGWCQQGGAPN